MKYDIKDKIIITDGPEYEKLKTIFAEQEALFEERQHGSMTEEVRRIIKTSCKAVLNQNQSTAFNNFLQLASKDINANLEKTDLQEGAFYISGKKNENAVIRVNELIHNEFIEILWFTKTHKFLRRLTFIDWGEEKTKIKYEDICKGMTTVFGFMDNYKKTKYQKNVKKSFQVQMLDLELLSETDPTQVEKIKAKIAKLKKVK